MKAINRLIQYIQFKGVSMSAFEKKVGLSNGYIATQSKRNADLGEGVLVKIVDYCQDLNPIWLLFGTGDMILPDGKIASQVKMEVIPLESLEIEGEVTRRGHTSFRELGGGYTEVETPLVPERAAAGYAASWSNEAQLKISEFPRFKVTMKDPTLGEYMAFEVEGESMNNGLLGSIPAGSIVTGRNLEQKYWRSRLHLHKYQNYILVTDDGVQVKEIIDHRVEEGVVVCHSLNPDKIKYPDFELHLSEVKGIFYVKSITIV